jgi:hypothetical protein
MSVVPNLSEAFVTEVRHTGKSDLGNGQPRLLDFACHECAQLLR